MAQGKLVYTTIQSPRLTYALEHLLGAVSQTADSTKWMDHQGPRLWYHASAPPSLGLHICPTAETVWEVGTLPAVPSPILSENQLPDGSPYALPILYPTGGHLGYDAVAATFYMLSCAAEYDTNKTSLKLVTPLADLPDFNDFLDEHNRFRGNPKLKRIYKNSLPVLDLWKGQVLQSLRHLGFEVANLPAQPRLRLSLDIDNWYAFKGKPLWKQIGGAVRDLFLFGPMSVVQRLQVLVGAMVDPFDPNRTFDLLKEYPIDVFILNAQQQGPYDKNSPTKANLLAALQNKYPNIRIGIHPSYQGGENGANPSVWQKELDDLSQKIKQPITSSRFHYLHFRMPKHYRQLIELGITEDHSLMFANTPGWRAGTALPFYWYDLEAEKATNLTIYPQLLMDTRLVELYRRQPQEAAEWVLKTYINPLEAQGLPLPLVLHNESQGNYGVWRGWAGFLRGVVDSK